MWCYISILLQLWLIVNAENDTLLRQHYIFRIPISTIVERSANTILNTSIRLINKYSENLRRDASILNHKSQLAIDGFIFSVQDILNGRYEEGIRELLDASVKTIETGETLASLTKKESLNVANDAVNLAQKVHARLNPYKNRNEEILGRKKRAPQNPMMTPEQEEEFKKAVNETVNTGWKFMLDSVLPSVDQYYKKSEQEVQNENWSNKMVSNIKNPPQNQDGLSQMISFLDGFNAYHKEKLEASHKKEVLPTYQPKIYKSEANKKYEIPDVASQYPYQKPITNIKYKTSNNKYYNSKTVEDQSKPVEEIEEMDKRFPNENNNQPIGIIRFYHIYITPKETEEEIPERIQKPAYNDYYNVQKEPRINKIDENNAGNNFQNWIGGLFKPEDNNY